MTVPVELFYAPTHEWICLEGDEITVGITQHAQALLGDLVFVELPLVGADCQPGEEIAVIESVKAAADVYSPVTGEIIEINKVLAEHPELVNQDPYGQGWLFRVKLSDIEELDNLLHADDYAAQILADEE